MTMDELSVLDGSKCILQLRGVRPFLSRKYDITKHPNYKYLSDYDPKNAFDIEAYLHCKLKLKANEEYDTYEVDAAETDMEEAEQEEQNGNPPDRAEYDEELSDEPLDSESYAEEAFDYGALF